jgi:hypothetical protein
MPLVQSEYLDPPSFLSNQKGQDISRAHTCITPPNVQETNWLMRNTEVTLKLSTVFPTCDVPIKAKGWVGLSCRKGMLLPVMCCCEVRSEWETEPD